MELDRPLEGYQTLEHTRYQCVKVVLKP